MNRDYGIAVAKKGTPVQVATPILTKFNSKFNTFLILKEDLLTITTDGSGEATTTILHGLKYKPAFLAFAYKSLTTNFLGVQYANAYWHCESGIVSHFYNDGTIGWLHGIMVTSGEDNINIHIWGMANTQYKIYIYTFIDLAEETKIKIPSTGKDYGIRIAQSGFDARKDPDYRMIYTSKYKVFKVFKTGQISVSAPAITLSDGQDDLRKTEQLFADLEIAEGYYPFLLMAENKNVYTGNPIESEYFLDYIPNTGLYTFSPIDAFRTEYQMFLCKDRVVAYIWRSYYTWFGEPPTINYPAVTINFRYMLLKPEMTFT